MDIKEGLFINITNGNENIIAFIGQALKLLNQKFGL